MKDAVLVIHYKVNNRLHREQQGKVFKIGAQAVYLADIGRSKWWRNYSGYSISKQILDAFSKKKLRVLIAYRWREKGTIYFTKPSDFIKHGILIAYGGHSQYVLPIKNWKAKQMTLDDPHDLPELTLDRWLKPEGEMFYEGL